ncbi:MAG: hypothetical protein KBT34_14880 [Prevotella sp.]|nr:hypothetical protein [Candidatus Prevotella equi]
MRTSILPFLTIFCGAISTLGWYRRDFLVLLVAYFVIMLHIRQLKKCNGRAVFVLSQILMILLMLIHEASFFFVFPILLLITWFISSGTVLKQRKIQICAKYFIMPLISMAAITLMKGNEEIANSIWRSWSNLFVRYPEENIPDIGAGVRWLTNGIKDTTEFHLDLNFQMHLGILAITKNIIMLLITLFTTYFLMLRNLYVDFCNKRIIYSENNTAIANTLLIQLFFMTPMFIFLSTDYPRTILYCVVTSVFIVYSLKKYNLTIYYPKTGSDISLNINKYVERSNIYSNPCFYFSIVLLYPISQFGYIRLPYDCLLYKYLSFVKYCILTTYKY